MNYCFIGFQGAVTKRNRVHGGSNKATVIKEANIIRT